MSRRAEQLIRGTLDDPIGRVTGAAWQCQLRLVSSCRSRLRASDIWRSLFHEFAMDALEGVARGRWRSEPIVAAPGILHHMYA